jgi:uncharacterized protein YndB with AHSA1/START domain
VHRVGRVPSYSDYMDLLKRKGTKKPEVLPHPTLLKAIEQARTVVGHPGWQFFLDSMQVQVTKLEKNRSLVIEQMIKGDATNEPLTVLKFTLREIEGELRGLHFAATLIPTTVDLGTKITGELTQAAAGGPTNQTGVQGAADLTGAKG